jgi:hypothetical protein
MKQKNFLKLIVAAAIVVFISSCAKDNTSPADPGADRDKYVGSWSCKETQGATTIGFTITIQKFGDLDTLYVYNFDNLGANEKAMFIVNDNSVVIPTQDITSFTISGSGTFSNNKINLTYTVDSDPYTAVCSK